MKVFLVHPGFNWSSGEISRSAERALIRLGCQVTSFDPFYGMGLFGGMTGKASAAGLRSTRDMALRLTCERIPLRVIEEKPDLFLAVHGGRLPVNVVKAVRTLGVPTAVWLLDDPHEIDLSSRYARAYDQVFTDERLAVPVHAAAGSANVYHLPLGCAPDIHFPRVVPEHYRSDVCLVGSGFKERADLLVGIQDELMKYRVRLVGWWPSLPTDSPLRSCLIDRVVSPEETALYCAGARIVLNPHRDASGCAMASNLWGVPAASPNPRLFEAAACGAFILTDNRRADVGRYFDIGREMDTYSDGTELVAKIKNWLGRDEERFSGARAACEKARKHYTLDVRMRELLETAGAWQCAAGRQAVAV